MDIAEVNRLVKQFDQAKKMMKQMPGMMKKKVKRECLKDFLFCINEQQKFKEVKVMAVKIRLRRMGQKKAPFYRIVVSDSRSPRDGKFIEEDWNI